MSLFKRLFKSNEPEGGREIEHPGGGFASPLLAMESLIARMRAWAQEGEVVWATFTLPKAKDGQDIRIEVLGDELNMLLEELPAELVAETGLERLDHGLYRAPGADAARMAGLVDLVIRRHYGLPASYTVRGRIQN